MEAKINKGKTDNDVPYTELYISPCDPRDEPFYISFRMYPRRVFVGVEDYRGDQSGGADLEDCWSAPVYIVQKTLKEEFDPKQAYLNALKFLEEEYYADDYEKIEGVVRRWMNG